MKGIILAGGNGSRLRPMTANISKQLLPVYDKPMIYYPLSVLMIADIREILIISDPGNISLYKSLLANGKSLGLSLSYRAQLEPKGIPDVFNIAEDFIKDDSTCLILGDNIFYGQGFKSILNKAKARDSGATIFGYQVTDPERFGVVEFDDQQKAISLEEKPERPKSKYAVTGIYFYDNQVIEIAKNLTPSLRNELEITDVNRQYLIQDEIYVEEFGRGFAWLDTGTHESLMAAGQFVQVIEERQGLKISCLEELGYRNGWISREQLIEIAVSCRETSYGNYLYRIAK